ncbi:hypothetical protein RvY_05886 [Ramazzottius varieornatus]|uniref:Uncharacterized protein n=1 Tax=Ramazzottius varieornatus TaxID=947166 RepID=A0A1D1UX33_RAMVA|nr:hypothetical protein RvY_05886 [Ramazzottius varieornatus]
MDMRIKGFVLACQISLSAVVFVKRLDVSYKYTHADVNPPCGTFVGTRVRKLIQPSLIQQQTCDSGFSFERNSFASFDFSSIHFASSTGNRAATPLFTMEHVTKEKHEVHSDGSEKHTIKTGMEDNRTLGDKMHAAKDAYKGGPEDKARVTTEKHHVEGGHATHEIKSDVKDQRTMGEKLGDAKDAFTGKH